MEQLITDRLRDNLSRLKLTQAAEVLDVILKQAEVEKSSYMSFLDHLSMGMKSVPLMGKQKCTTSQLKRLFCTGLAAGPGGQ